MIKRIVEITRASWISLKDRQLVVEQDNKVVAKVPIEDLGILLLANLANVITQQALMACQQSNVVVVLCDEKYLPLSLVLPLAGGDFGQPRDSTISHCGKRPLFCQRSWLQIGLFSAYEEKDSIESSPQFETANE